MRKQISPLLFVCLREGFGKQIQAVLWEVASWLKE
jgi:hypothetical protein